MVLRLQLLTFAESDVHETPSTTYLPRCCSLRLLAGIHFNKTWTRPRFNSQNAVFRFQGSAMISNLSTWVCPSGLLVCYKTVARLFPRCGLYRITAVLS